MAGGTLKVNDWPTAIGLHGPLWSEDDAETLRAILAGKKIKYERKKTEPRLPARQFCRLIRLRLKGESIWVLENKRQEQPLESLKVPLSKLA